MSAWLNNSLDPVSGADKKNDQYWGDVAHSYNMTTPKQRSRNAKQAKDRWHKINKWTDLFHSAWLKAQQIFTSGHNDEMWIEKTLILYEEDNKLLKLGRFVLMDVWYAVRKEAKWITYNDELKKARKRKVSDEVEGSEDIHHVDDECQRPMGQKRAKKVAHELQVKSKISKTDVEELDKYGKIQFDSHANRMRVLEKQEKLSVEKIKSMKIAHLAAKENKEAKLLETYNLLLSKDIRQMSDEEKADHVETMKCLKKRLFPEIN